MTEYKTYLFHAHNFTDTLKLKGIDKILEGSATVQSATKLIYQDGEGYFFIYRFGSIIFFNIDQARQKEVLDRITGFTGQKPEILTTEQFTVEVRPNEKSAVGFEHAVLDKITLDRLDILALVLAQSTSLEYFEIKVDEMLKQSDDIGADLKKTGRLAKRASDIKKFIGNCITTKQDLVATLYILDKPDETWNNQVLDSLYKDAADMFELKDRYKTLDYKLRMIQENLELISDLLQHRNANRLEMSIIILIVVEILLFLWQMFYLK